MKQVFKFQRPISTNADIGNLILIYNKSRSIDFQEEYDDDFVTEIFGDEYKVFYEVEIDKEGTIILGDKVEGWVGDKLSIAIHTEKIGTVEMFSVDSK